MHEPSGVAPGTGDAPGVPDSGEPEEAAAGRPEVARTGTPVTAHADMDAVGARQDGVEIAPVLGGDLDAPPSDDTDLDPSALDAIEQELADVERALAKLDDGTYGRCEVCGSTIDEAELARSPAARFCADHLPLSMR